MGLRASPTYIPVVIVRRVKTYSLPNVRREPPRSVHHEIFSEIDAFFSAQFKLTSTEASNQFQDKFGKLYTAIYNRLVDVKSILAGENPKDVVETCILAWMKEIKMIDAAMKNEMSSGVKGFANKEDVEIWKTTYQSRSRLLSTLGKLLPYTFHADGTMLDPDVCEVGDGAGEVFKAVDEFIAWMKENPLDSCMMLPDESLEGNTRTFFTFQSQIASAVVIKHVQNKFLEVNAKWLPFFAKHLSADSSAKFFPTTLASLLKDDAEKDQDISHVTATRLEGALKIWDFKDLIHLQMAAFDEQMVSVHPTCLTLLPYVMNMFRVIALVTESTDNVLNLFPSNYDQDSLTDFRGCITAPPPYNVLRVNSLT